MSQSPTVLKLLLIMAALVAGSPRATAQPPADDLALETDPAVRAAVELPRTEPSHYLWAIFSLTDLGRPELAGPILKELGQLNLSNDQRADLVDEFGSRRMLELARNDALAPDGGALAEACMAAAAARAGLPPAGESAARLVATPMESELETRRLQTLIQTADARALSAALGDAMERDDVTAAAALAEALGRSEDASVLQANSPQPAAVVDALVYPDRSVRFAALQAIMALEPKSAFPGSSRVRQTLDYLATASGERRAVVLMPLADHATTLAGRLVGMGITADPAVRGGPAMRLARQSADLELLLLDFNIHSPGIRDMLYALRTDPATGRTPIGLLATSDRLEAAKRLAAEHRGVIVFPRPQSDEWVAQIIERLSRLSDCDQLSPEERAEIGRQARAWAEAPANRASNKP
jgi:CheY-like chemotaxis protein